MVVGSGITSLSVKELPVRRSWDQRLGVVLILVLASTVAPTVSRAAPSRGTLLPDLIAMPPEHVLGPTTQFEIPWGVDVPYLFDGCYLDERVRKAAERCLRFDGIVGNIGDGPLELAYGLDVSRYELVAQQRIFYSDGSYKDRFATRTEYHPNHSHFHVEDFYVATLWRSRKSGGRLGKRPVSSSDKNGFCPEDSDRIDNSTLTGSSYSCTFESGREPSRVQVVGISAGWKDIYGFNLPDQFVEISGIPDGYYALQLEIDPDDVFEESDETNNLMCVVVRLEGSTAELVRAPATC